jgi:hypothetical protein
MKCIQCEIHRKDVECKTGLCDKCINRIKKVVKKADQADVEKYI